MKNLVCTIAGILTIIGAINWGLIGLFNFNLVSALFANLPVVQKAIYILIGLSGVVYGGLKLADNKLF